MRRPFWPVIAILASQTAYAQRVQPEIRVDAFASPIASLQPGIGAIYPLGYYVRLGANMGWSIPLDPSRDSGNSWRGDITARVTLDPFRQQRWGLSFGGGLSVRRQTYLAAIVDLEGPEMRGLLPALQLGVSGGVRAGVMLRRAVKGRR